MLGAAQRLSTIDSSSLQGNGSIEKTERLKCIMSVILTSKALLRTSVLIVVEESTALRGQVLNVTTRRLNMIRR